MVSKAGILYTYTQEEIDKLTPEEVGICSFIRDDGVMFESDGVSFTEISGGSGGLVVSVPSSGATTPNYTLGENSSIDAAVGRSICFSATNAAFPNKIGFATKPTGTDLSNSSEWSSDVGYIAGSAGVAVIQGGYDNINNQIAGTMCGGGHNFIQYNVDGHATILGGSYNWISAGRGFIGAGKNNSIIGTGSLSAIVAGIDNRVNNCSRSAIGGGTSNTIEGNDSTISGGDSNTISTGVQRGYIGGGANGQITAGNSPVISGGNLNIASADYAVVAGGYNNTASGTYTFVAGRENTVDGTGAAALGESVKGSVQGSINFSSRKHSAQGDSQATSFAQSQTTTDATPKYLSSYGATTYAPIPDNSSWCGTIHLVGRESATGDVSAFKIEFCCERDGGVASLVYASTPTELVNQITAGTPNINIHSTGLFRIQVTGVAAKTILWTARVDIAQVVGT